MAIYEEYREELFTIPSTSAGWKMVASQFGDRWNFHHACGAIDGKHVAIKKPNKSGSLYYNYKGFFSIVLLAVADAQYKFLWANVGANGSASDAGVFDMCRLRPDLEENRHGFPPPEALPGDDRNIPYFLLGDDAFPLRTWIMKPFSRQKMTHAERVFNYRLSRARRVVENAFGIMAQRWRCLLTTLQLSPMKAITVVNATMALHNLLRTRCPHAIQPQDVDQEDDFGNFIPGSWREGVQMADPNKVKGNRLTRPGKVMRNYLSYYYNYNPRVRLPWQDRVA